MDKIKQQVVVVSTSTLNLETGIRYHLDPLFEQGWRVTSSQLVGDGDYRTAMFVLAQDATVVA